MNNLFRRYSPHKNTALIRVVFSIFLTLLLFQSPAVPLEWVAWKFQPQVALTFDDGPHPLPTRQLLEVLDHYHTPATFFIVGKIAVQYPDLLRAMTSCGHELANHTWNHGDVRNLSTSALRKDLDQTRWLIESITGKQTFLFRTPGTTEHYLRRSFRVPAGYELVLWDVHSLDQEGLSANVIASRVLAQVKDGDVILMHNGLASTREALNLIIPALQERGYEFVTVSQLMQTRDHSEVRSRSSSFIQG